MAIDGKSQPIFGMIIALMTVIGTAVTAVWSARNHAEAQVLRLEDSFQKAIEHHERRPHEGTLTNSEHEKDYSFILLRLDRIEAKIDKLSLVQRR